MLEHGSYNGYTFVGEAVSMVLYASVEGIVSFLTGLT